jgi:hypothetical protein
MFTDVSEERVTSIFKAEEYSSMLFYLTALRHMQDSYFHIRRRREYQFLVTQKLMKCSQQTVNYSYLSLNSDYDTERI